MLRSEVGKQLGTRLTPSLEFIHDELPETADHLNELLAEARRRDEESHALAATAQYAGDADPYVKPREADEIQGGSADFDDDEDDELDELEDNDELDDSEDYEDDDEVDDADDTR